MSGLRTRGRTDAAAAAICFALGGALLAPATSSAANQSTAAAGGTSKSKADFSQPLRVQVFNIHMFPPNLYHNYYYPKPKYLIIGYLDP